MTAPSWRVRPTLGPTPQWPELIVAGADRLAIASAYRRQVGLPDDRLVSTFPAVITYEGNLQ